MHIEYKIRDGKEVLTITNNINPENGTKLTSLGAYFKILKKTTNSPQHLLTTVRAPALLYRYISRKLEAQRDILRQDGYPSFCRSVQVLTQDLFEEASFPTEVLKAYLMELSFAVEQGMFSDEDPVEETK